jgi:Putative peptidoglycan binding domain
MSAKLDKIANHFLETLVPHPKYNSANLNPDRALLLPEFQAALKACIVEYKKTHAGQDITFTETYRSNALQLKHFNNGASKIKADGMHHFGVACDSIFIIGGKRTYKGDVVGLRKIYKNNGLFILGMWDALHVQFIPTADQAGLRKTVRAKLIAFQKANGLPQTGKPDAATIAMAKLKFKKPAIA